MIETKDKRVARIAELYRLIDKEKDGRKTVSLQKELDELNMQVKKDIDELLADYRKQKDIFEIKSTEIISSQKSFYQQAKEATLLSRQARELVEKIVVIKRQIRDAAEANRKKRK